METEYEIWYSMDPSIPFDKINWNLDDSFETLEHAKQRVERYRETDECYGDTYRYVIIKATYVRHWEIVSQDL